MNWSEYLNPHEQIRWQGRPAPRCYTFRNWLHSLFGIVILIAASGWLINGLHLAGEQDNIFFGLLPIPFILVGGYLAFGHLVLARLEWEQVFFALTEQRLIKVGGLFSRSVEVIPVEDIVWFELRPIGETLGTVRIRGRRHQHRLSITCIEQPRKLTELLEKIIDANGIDITVRNE